MVNKGAAPMVARLTPFSGAYSQVGPKGSDRYFKYLEPQKDVVTKKNYDKARESWLKEKSKSNEKAQKDSRNTLNKGRWNFLIRLGRFFWS